MAKGKVTISKFWGGLSDTDTRMAEGQFAYGENIEIRRDPDFIELSRKPVLGFTTTNFVTAIGVDESISNPINRYFFTDQGEVLDDTGALLATLAGNYRIFDTITFNGNLLFFYDTGAELKIGVFDTVGLTISNSDFVLPIPGPAPIGGGEECYPVVNVSDDFLYVGSGKIVYRLQQQPGGLLPTIGITLESKIRGISSVGNQLKIFLENGRLYYWDGFSKEHDVYQQMNTRFRFSYTQSNTDYVFGGVNLNFSEMYLNQGLQFQLFKKFAISHGAENKSKFNFTLPGSSGAPFKCTQAYAQYLNIIYGVVNASGGTAICSWGQLYNGYPVSFNIDTTIASTGDQIVEIGALNTAAGGPVLYYSWEDDQGIKGVDFINLGWFASDTSPGFEFDDYQPSGSIYTQKFTLDHTDLKQNFEGELRFDGTAAGRTLTISYSLDGGPYTQWIIVDEDTDDPVSGVKTSKFRRITTPEIADSFYEIQFRIDFATDNQEISPRLYTFDLKYDTIEN